MPVIHIPHKDAEELAYGTPFDDYEIVFNEMVDTGRWNSQHELVIKLRSTGKFYRAYYERGLTEYQDCETFPDDVGDTVSFREVKPRTVETIVYDTIS